jgi:hypothetical protein
MGWMVVYVVKVRKFQPNLCAWESVNQNVHIKVMCIF